MKQFYIDNSGIIKYRVSTPTVNTENHITEENDKEDNAIWVLPNDSKPIAVIFEENTITVRDEGYNCSDNLTFYFVDPVALQLYFEYLGTEKEFTLIRKKCEKCGKYKKGKRDIKEVEKEVLKRYGEIYGIGGIVL